MSLLIKLIIIWAPFCMPHHHRKHLVYHVKENIYFTMSNNEHFNILFPNLPLFFFYFLPKFVYREKRLGRSGFARILYNHWCLFVLRILFFYFSSSKENVIYFSQDYYLCYVFCGKRSGRISRINRFIFKFIQGLQSVINL